MQYEINLFKHKIFSRVNLLEVYKIDDNFIRWKYLAEIKRQN
jgi:hypothetical protein